MTSLNEINNDCIDDFNTIEETAMRLPDKFNELFEFGKMTTRLFQNELSMQYDSIINRFKDSTDLWEEDKEDFGNIVDYYKQEILDFVGNLKRYLYKKDQRIIEFPDIGFDFDRNPNSEKNELRVSAITLHFSRVEQNGCLIMVSMDVDRSNKKKGFKVIVSITHANNESMNERFELFPYYHNEFQAFCGKFYDCMKDVLQKVLIWRVL